MLRYNFDKHDQVQHRYGGVYEFIGHATDTATGQEVVIYQHVWPFEGNELYSRPSTEFYDGRFRKLSDIEFMAIKNKLSTEAMREIIKHNKANGLTVWSA